MKPDPAPAVSSPEFQAYLRARDAVLRMKSAESGGGAADPSAYWTEELGNIDYLIDASPLIVRKLRHHAFHITGIRPYDYRTKDDRRRELFEGRLAALRVLDREGLLVPEAPALGGFGYEIGGRTLNVDTLKFYEVLIGMQRGGVLDAIRGAARPVVCEIGAGWGGFAYQFKTLFPRATYVVVDFAELFLFSATYLGALFPDARLLFCDGNSIEGWRDADFVFVPHTEAAGLTSLPLDLTVNMVSFQEMTASQVRGYADIAADAGCPLLYSLNRERSPYNTELVRVTDELSSRYALREVAVLDTDYTSAMKKPAKPGQAAERTDLNYRHVVGRMKPAGAAAGVGASAEIRSTGTGSGPRVLLGMTLYNNAPRLAEAIESLLAQTYPGFALFLLDDASSDGTPAIATEYVRRDARVRYIRHPSRQAMIATWREVVEIAAAAHPSAEYFAWASDHDRWDPRWLERMVGELDGDAGAVLAYPITQRTDQAGAPIEKGPRTFDTAGCHDLAERWSHFCRAGVGAGDMVYGLIRLAALQQAGIFRRVLRPDRLLMAELTLRGRIRQVPEVLWFRRESIASSIQRQHATLVLDGDAPRWFSAPPWLQHTLALWREYVRPQPRPLPLSTTTWLGMLLLYQVTYGRRHFRKTRTSHAIGRGIENTVTGWKLAKHYYRHAVYNTLVGLRALWGKSRRVARRLVYYVLVLTHRLGLRGRGETPNPMNILFVARHFTYFRNFESVIRLLAERGHDVHLAAERDETIGGSAMVAGLTSNYPNVTAGEAPGREDDEWREPVTTLRLAVDYLRYLEPMYDGTPALRSRAAERAPAFAVRFGASLWARSRAARASARALLRRAEDALPSSARIEAFLRHQRPDVMLITPLVGVIESPQPDYVRAARILGVPTALCVWSWDHLSSKALIRDRPDRVLVWNDIQRQEAVRLHRVPAERVVVTGAQCFDRWFSRRPSRTREQFCAQAGLPADRPFVLYVGSALFRGSPSESAFVHRWIQAIRRSTDPVLRTAGVLVRPHPQRMKEWGDADPAAADNGASGTDGPRDVAVWGGNPVTEQARDDYFDALFHSAAVVGLNTSAFLEAAIAGKPVLAILPPEFAANQEGTIHFHYLTSAGGGLLQISRSLDEHASQLAAAIAAPGPPAANASFVEAFLRPRGLATAATPVFVDAVEGLAAQPVQAGLPAASPVGRATLRALRRLEQSPRGRLWLMDAEQRRSHDRHEAKVRGVEAQQRQRADERALKAAGKDARVQRKREQVEAWRRDKRQRPGA